MIIPKNKYDCWLWKKIMPLSVIKKINNKIKKNKSISNDIPATNVIKTSKVKVLDYNIIEEDLLQFIKRVYLVNNNEFGYNLHYPFFEFFHFNEYSFKDKAEYGWHHDESIHLHGDIKLTLLINISEKKYEGGVFELFNNGNHHPIDFNDVGDMLVFKSHLVHRVTPVLKGIRKTLTIFLTGPKFI
jgi:PKHD-type hydroxylase